MRTGRFWNRRSRTDTTESTRSSLPTPPASTGSIRSPANRYTQAPLYHVYGHFIIESCQRLWWAADHPDLPIVWTADDATAPELNSWEQDILEILGIRNEIIILTRPTRFDCLHVPDAGYKYADWSHRQQ
ncbi:MAG: glycosyltransferase family 61 protein, partial [Propionibacteriaceae bacterium]|nr:glycosyltransferase family 61 protein [Propionibacteriaceae bacterium]